MDRMIFQGRSFVSGLICRQKIKNLKPDKPQENLTRNLSYRKDDCNVSALKIMKC